jgi:hypothetical protein
MYFGVESKTDFDFNYNSVKYNRKIRVIIYFLCLFSPTYSDVHVLTMISDELFL